MKNAFVIVTLSGLLSACAVAPVPPVVDSVPLALAEPDEAEPPGADTPEAPELEENLPNVPLTAHVRLRPHPSRRVRGRPIDGLGTPHVRPPHPTPSRAGWSAR